MTDFNVPIKDVMTSENLITVPVGTTLEQAREILRKNKVEQMQKQTELAELKQKLTTDYANGMNQYQNNHRNFLKQKDNYHLAEKVYEVTLDQYREGVVSMIALLQDELSMSNALNNYLNAYHSYKLSELKLLKLSKQLSLLTE